MSNKLEMQNEIVDAILIVVMMLVILNPVVFGIQIDVIPACLYALTYNRRNNFLQAFLDGSIIGLAAIRSNNFLPLLIIFPISYIYFTSFVNI